MTIDIGFATIAVLIITTIFSSATGTVVGIIIARYFPKFLDRMEKGVEKLTRNENGNSKHT